MGPSWGHAPGCHVDGIGQCRVRVREGGTGGEGEAEWGWGRGCKGKMVGRGAAAAMATTLGRGWNPSHIVACPPYSTMLNSKIRGFFPCMLNGRRKPSWN